MLCLRPALLLQPMWPKWHGTTSADSIAVSYMTSVRPSVVKPLKHGFHCHLYIDDSQVYGWDGVNLLQPNTSQTDLL